MIEMIQFDDHIFQLGGPGQNCQGEMSFDCHKPQRQIFQFFLQEIMTNEAWGHGFRLGFSENTLKTCIKIVIVLEILELEFCIQNASWYGATSREAFRYTAYDFLVKMGWST